MVDANFEVEELVVRGDPGLIGRRKRLYRPLEAGRPPPAGRGRMLTAAPARRRTVGLAGLFTRPAVQRRDVAGCQGGQYAVKLLAAAAGLTVTGSIFLCTLG